jgi:hypothetical protein
MSRGSPTIAFRVSKTKRLALVKAGRMCGGLSPGQYTDRIVTERLVSDGLLPADFGANSGANSGAFPTPETASRPLTLAEQFGGRLHEPAIPRWPHTPRRLEPRSQPAIRDGISAGIAKQVALTQADGATANRPSREQQTGRAPGMMSDAMGARGIPKLRQ